MICMFRLKWSCSTWAHPNQRCWHESAQMWCSGGLTAAGQSHHSDGRPFCQGLTTVPCPSSGTWCMLDTLMQQYSLILTQKVYKFCYLNGPLTQEIYFSGLSVFTVYIIIQDSPLASMYSRAGTGTRVLGCVSWPEVWATLSGKGHHRNGHDRAPDCWSAQDCTRARGDGIPGSAGVHQDYGWQGAVVLCMFMMAIQPHQTTSFVWFLNKAKCSFQIIFCFCSQMTNM